MNPLEAWGALWSTLILTFILYKIITVLDVHVGFSFCLVLIVYLKPVQDLRNRIKFLSFHKLLPVNLTWLSQVYGKMFNFPICWFVLENVYLKILSLNILILWLMLLPCYRLMLLPLIKFGRYYNQIDNGMLLISILMADVIAICGWWNATIMQCGWCCYHF